MAIKWVHEKHPDHLVYVSENGRFRLTGPVRHYKLWRMVDVYYPFNTQDVFGNVRSWYNSMHRTERAAKLAAGKREKLIRCVVGRPFLHFLSFTTDAVGRVIELHPVVLCDRPGEVLKWGRPVLLHKADNVEGAQAYAAAWLAHPEVPTHPVTTDRTLSHFGQVRQPLDDTFVRRAVGFDCDIPHFAVRDRIMELTSIDVGEKAEAV